MKALLLAALLSGPAAAQSLPGALVWLPPEDFRHWSAVDAALRAHSSLKLTIGLTPAMATPLAKAALGPWAAAGRVELASRLGGDPVLPLVASHPAAPRPNDALERAVEARERLSKRLGALPGGVVPGAGALDGALAAALGASGHAWVLAGPYAAAADAPWASAGRAVVVPARALSLPADRSWTEPGAAVFDESASASSAFLDALETLGSARPALDWTTVGELARAKAEPRAELSAVAWTAWDPAAAVNPPADPSSKAAWDAYGEAAAAVDRYQNSGAADLKTLDGAVELLKRAQKARYFRPASTEAVAGAAPDSAEVPADLRRELLAVYKRLKVSAPDALYGGASTGPADGTPAEGPTGVKVLQGPNWVEFRAPAGSIALDPAAVSSSGTAVDGGTAADPWRIRALRADWTDEAVVLTLRVGRATSQPPHPVYEVYIDFNRVLGAGRMAMLEGRGAVVMSRDAWELALSVVGDDARLYRARGGDPEEIGAYRAFWASDRGEVTVSLPRTVLRGNPARWGWSAVALAEDPARSGRRPAASLVGPSGTILLGVLAPVDTQKAVLSRVNPRVPAARLDN